MNGKSSEQKASTVYPSLEENFHPISWLQSVGQFLGEQRCNEFLASDEGIRSVRAAVV